MLVALWMRVKLRYLKKKSKTQKYNIELLHKCNDVRKKYNVSVKNKFEVLEKSKDLNACWEDISNILQESIKETVPIKEYKSSKKWMTEEIFNLIIERRRAKEVRIQ